MNADPTESKGQLARAAPSDYHTVLLRVIRSTTQDPAQLRSLVYELARIKLRRETWLQDTPLDPEAAKEHLRALESAIADVEAITASDDHPALPPPAPPATGPRETGQIISNARDLEPISVGWGSNGDVTILEPPPDMRHRQYERIALVSDVPPPHSAWGITLQVLKLVSVGLLGIMIAIMGVVGYVVIGGRTDLVDRWIGNPDAPRIAEERIAAQPPAPVPVWQPEVRLPPPPVEKPPPPFPIPTSYGVFALSDGQLYPLEMLPARPLDERVQVGPVVTKPPQAILPDGKVSFIVFRRDLVANAPDRVSVRVVSKIARAWPAGKPAVAVEDSWAIRGSGHEFRVGPAADEQQMILVKPESDDFTLTPGRYALVLKGQAYDFTVAGTPTDPVHCLERVDVVNGLVYSPCKPEEPVRGNDARNPKPPAAPAARR